MRFFKPRTQTEVEDVPETADADPAGQEIYLDAPPAMSLNETPYDSTTRLVAPPEQQDDHEPCEHCRGTGMKLRTSDYLGELVALLPSDSPLQMDLIIADFYRQLLIAAPHLIPTFPQDLVEGDALNSHGHNQRDQLLTALIQMLTRYDPDHPGSDEMQALKVNAQSWGRAHAEWQLPDGTIYVPAEEDYLTVRNTFVGLLADALGHRLKAEHVAALVRAYRTVSLWMQASADEWRMQRGAPTVARRSRQAASQ